MASALAAAITGLLALAVYASTAARTITWWDGSSYPLAAATFGIPGAPGSLLLTLLGGVVAHLPIPGEIPVAFRLNLLAALIGATTAAGVAGLGATLAKPPHRSPGGLELAAGVFAGLVFTFAVTPWTYATQFTPYGLSALFTVLIVAAALAWWDGADAPVAPARLGILFLLVGLDVSVHRTNLLLVPGLLAWIALRRPRADRFASVVSAFAGLGAGLAVHLLIIPLAARGPAFNIENPSDLGRFWSYVSMARAGGGFLVDLFPRRAPFLSVQLADLLRFLRVNLWPGTPAALVLAPLAVAGFGAVLAAREFPRRALALLALFVSAGLGAVIYFNRPESYFRPLDRHYLPTLVILAPMLAIGARGLLEAVLRVPEAGRSLIPSALAGLALLPIGSRITNVASCDLSQVRFAETYSRDVLATLPRNAILITNGDNDTFPPWYLQQVDGLRRDVSVINLPLANTSWFLEELGRRDSTLAGLADAPTPIRTAPGDSTVAIPVDPGVRAVVPASFTAPETLRIVPPRLDPAARVFRADEVVFELLRRFGWRRPLCLAVTLDAGALPWLQPYARLDGLVRVIVPSTDPAVQDLDGARRRLFEDVRYEGVANPEIPLDPTSLIMCRNYAAALIRLATLQFAAKDAEGCLETLDFLDRRAPVARWLPPGTTDPTVALRRQARSWIEERGADVAR